MFLKLEMVSVYVNLHSCLILSFYREYGICMIFVYCSYVRCFSVNLFLVCDVMQFGFNFMDLSCVML